MIRERRDEDLDALWEKLSAGGDAPQFVTRDWLVGRPDAETWVFDMAPVHVAPTRNVVAQVQVHTVDRDSTQAACLAATGIDPADALAIGRLVVAPVRHAHGFARHLLQHASRRVEAQGRTPVVDAAENAYGGPEFFARYGFVAAGEGLLVRPGAFTTA